MLAQSSYLSVNDKRLHFGLGNEKRVSLEIRWPNGKLEAIPDIESDRLVVIDEGSGIARTEVFTLSAARSTGQ